MIKRIDNKDFLITFICIFLSIIMGLLSNDLLIGGTIFATGLLCSYFAGIGKKVNYILGFVNYLLMGYIAYKNNLFGIFFFYIFLCSPLQIHGFLSWNKKLDEEQSIEVRKFTFKNSILIISSCILGSLLLGFLLTFIPNQQLA